MKGLTLKEKEKKILVVIPEQSFQKEKAFASRGALTGKRTVIPKKKLSEMKQMLGIAAV